MPTPDRLTSSLLEAKRAHQGGDPRRAEAAYRQWLQAHPSDPEVLHLLGLALAQTGRIAEALPIWRSAAQLMPNRADLWNNLGEACRRAGQVQEAVTHFQRAVQLAPQLAEAHFNLGNALKDAGRHDDAVASYRRAVSMEPNHRKAWFNLGNTLREQGKSPPARDAYLQALRLQPAWVEVLQNLGVTEMELDEVETALRRFQEAYRLSPQNGDFEDLQGMAYQKLGRTEEARRWYSIWAGREPDQWLRGLRLESLIEPIAADEEAIEANYARVEQSLNRTEATARDIDIAKLHNSGAEPPMALVYQRSNLRPLWDRFGDLFAARLHGDPPAVRTGKPHVGIVVTHGHEGVFAACFGGIAQRIASAELQASVVCPESSANILDHLCGAGALQYVRIPTRLDEAAQGIRASGIDMLYYWEVGTDSTNYFLPYLRPARIQAAGWGWPVSSGSPAVNVFISARGLEPEGAEAHYRERLATLSWLPTWYAKPRLPERLEPREAFGLNSAGHLYICHQNLRKWHPEFDRLLEQIFQMDPEAQLVFIGDKQRAVTDALLARLARTAPHAAERAKPITFLEKPRYLNLLALADVALDTRLYGAGANTAYDALAVGTPIVTWPAPLHRGRWAAAALTQVGCSELIADSAEKYCQLAVQVASDGDFRKQVRSQIQAACGELFEDSKTVDEHRSFFIESILRDRDR